MRLKDAISRSVAYIQHVGMGSPDFTLFFGYGVGDDLLCTTIAHELKKRGVQKIVMFSKYPGLFENNRDIMATRNMGYPTIGRRRRWGYGRIIPQYSGYDPAIDRDIFRSEHLITTMCRHAPITGEIDLRPYLFLSNNEKKAGRLFEKQAIIQSAGLPPGPHALTNKEWFPERFQEVSDKIRRSVSLVQLGNKTDPPIQGARDLRGKTTLRESAALMANSDVFIGQVGLLMHMARAVETRAVIVYGGREDPAISGYKSFDNIVGRTACSFCWQRSRCDFDHECMRMITADEVVAAVHRQLDLVGTPLELEHAFIQDAVLPAQV